MDLHREVYAMNADDSSGVDAKRAHVDKAYQLVLCSFERLSFAAIGRASSVKGDFSLHIGVNDQYARKITSNTLEDDPRTGEVGFTHPCAREFLEDSNGMFGSKFGAVENHTTLAEASLAVLMVPSLYKSATTHARDGDVGASINRRESFYQ
jgi:hypothetical protein